MAYPKRHFSVTTRDFYHDYVKTSEDDITVKQYRGFIDDIFKEMFEMMFTSKFHLTFPNGLGDIFAAAYKPKGWYAKYYDHSDMFGKDIKIKWDKKFAAFRTSKFYGFKLNDWSKRKRYELKNRIKAGELPVPDTFDKPLPRFIDLENE